MLKKIEIDILLFIIFEAIILLSFFKESYLTIIMGYILGIILIYVTKNIKKNSFTKILLFLISIFLSIIVFYQIIDFISYNILKNYSIFIIIISFLLITVYLLLKKYHTFIKTLEVSFSLFLVIKIISIILIIPEININNINNISFSFNYHFIYLGIIIWYFYKTINYLTNYMINKKRIIISFFNPLLMKLSTILVLGNTIFNIYKYPYVNYLKTIRYFDFIERVDGILMFEYLICFFYLLSFLLQSMKLLYFKKIEV